MKRRLQHLIEVLGGDSDSVTRRLRLSLASQLRTLRPRNAQ